MTVVATFFSALTLAIILSFYSISSAANSCMTTEKMVKDWSEKYKQQVQISVKVSGDEYLVEASFPTSLEDRKFNSLLLFKGKPADDATLIDDDFAMQLAAWKNEDGFVHFYYTIKSYLAEDNYLNSSYGEGCELSIQFFVDFSLAKEK